MMKAKHITEGFVFMEGSEEITMRERKVGNYLVWCGYGPRTLTWVTRGEPGGSAENLK
jgi:hypothetical protein